MEQDSVVSLIENRTLTPDEIGLLASLIADEPDHYTVLGVDRNASPEEIKAAYCLAVEFFHPLKSGRLAESDSVMHWKLSAAFARIKEAFTVLSGRSRRKVYEPKQSGWPDRAVPQAQLRRNTDSRQRSQGERSPAGRLRPSGAVPQAQRHRNADSRKPSQGGRSQTERTHQGAGQDRTTEIRKAEQVPVNLPLRVVFDRHWQEVTEATDVTGLGTRFRLSRRVEPGTLLRLEMSMPKHLRTRGHDEELYVVNAFVIYSNQDDSGGDVVAEFV
jgi:curved DNA-binding protein CbpA